MAGLADLLGYGSNPIYQALSPYSNTIAGAGMGLASGKNWTEGIQNAIAGAAGGNAADIAYQRQLKEEEENAAKVNATIEFFKAKYPDLAQAVEAGYSITDAYNEAWARERAAQSGGDDGFTLSPGQTRYGEDGNVLASMPAASEAMSAPTVQSRFNATTGQEEKVVWNPSTGAWDPFGGTKVAGGAGDLSAVETRELFETEDTIQAANNVISALDTALSLNPEGISGAGFGAEATAALDANVPDFMGMGNDKMAANTLQLKNIVTEQALSQLKLVFGGNPTEGERQILLDIQGSVDQPREVRKRIFERAKELALIRLKFNEERRNRIMGGGYGTIAGSSAPRGAGGFTVLSVD